MSLVLLPTTKPILVRPFGAGTRLGLSMISPGGFLIQKRSWCHTSYTLLSCGRLNFLIVTAGHYLYPSSTLVNLACTTINNRSRDRFRRLFFERRPFLFVPFVEDSSCGHLIQVITVFKEEELRAGDIWARECRMNLVSTTRTCQFPVLLCNGRQPLANLFINEFGYLHRLLMDTSSFRV